MTTKNFNVKNGLTTGNIILDAATGNITATNANLGNLVTANYFSGNGYYLTDINPGSIGTVANANYAAYAGNITTAAQPNITSVGTLDSLTVTASITGGNLITTGNANVGNLKLSGTVSSNLIPTTTDIYQLGTSIYKWKELYLSGNIYFGSSTLTDNGGVFTTGNANVTGTLTAGNIYANSGTIQGNLLTGTLTTGNQPNISNIGTLGNLTVTSNITTGGIKSDNYYYANGAPLDFQQPAGSNSQIQYNLNGDFGASSALTFNSTTSTLSVGNVSSTGTISAATLGGNLSTAAQPNVTSLGTLTGLTVSGATHVTDTTASTTTSSGALIVDGGVGIGGNINVNGKAVLGSDVTVGGNLTVNGTFTTVNSTTVTVVDPIFTLHTGVNDATLTTDDGKDVGLKMDYYKGSAKSAFIGWTNDSGYLEYYANATETAGVITGDYGTIKGLSYISTVATGTAPFVVSSTTQVANLNAATAGTVTSSSQPNITNVGTLDSLSVTGTLSAGVFSGNGSSLSNINGANVSQVGTANYAAYAGNITIAAQPNITSVGTLTSLTVSGNVSAGNIDGGNLVKANYVQGVLTTGAQPNITSVGTLGNLVVTDDITANTMHIGTGITIAGSTITAATFNGNVTGNITGTIAAPGSNTEITFNDAGYLGSTSKLTINKTSGLLTVTGNINASNANLGNLVTANYFSGDAYLLSNIAGGNVTGTVANATYATSAGSATTAGTVTTAAQPNITSVGTLGTLSVTGTITSGNVSTGNIAGNITTAAQPNITSVGTLTSLTVSGTSIENLIKLDKGISSNRTSVTVSGATIIDQFPTTSYRGAKYIITGKSDNGFQSTEVLLVHADTQSYITIYGFLTSGTDDVFEITSNVDVIGGNVRLYATNVTTNTSLNLVATYVQD